MGERKGVNKYYPPDFDPSKGSLNTWLGSHPLRDRARKLHKGILVIRFEMPYNIWCGGCNNHIGMGVRYNAEKSKVGSYYTTPIYKFRMKCHLCDNYFEIQTDPKNHDYVILEGARRKEQRWDPKENEQIVPEDKATQKKLATDPMYKLEHGSDDHQRGNVTHMSVAQIEDQREVWLDDYMLNKMARNKFRGEKKQIAVAKAADQALLDKSSLDIKLLPEEESDRKLAGLIKYSVTASFEENRLKKRKEIESRPLFSAKPSTSSSSSCTLTPKSSADSSLGRRALIKQKLGLHLSSPRVEHALNTGSRKLKGLVKKTVQKTAASPSTSSAAFSAEAPADGFSQAERLCDDPQLTPSSTTTTAESHLSVESNQMTSDDVNRLEEQDVEIDMKEEREMDELAMKSESESLRNESESMKSNSHETEPAKTVSAESEPLERRVSFDESEPVRGGSSPETCETTDCAKVNSACQSSNGEPSSSKLRWSCEEDSTGLAALMASYADSDSSNSGAENV